MMTDASGPELIAEARRLIGDGQPDDYVIQPARHAAEYEERAPALAEVLRRAGPETAAHEFERLDGEAVEAQGAFKRTAGRANLAVLATACLSAAMLVAGAVDLPDDAQRLILGALGVLSVVGGGFGAMWLFRLKQGGLLDRWNRARAQAESRRLDYFRRVVEAEPGLPTEVPLDLLLLEYFRRYQLDVQVAFYRSRSRTHRRDADRVLRVESVAVLLAAVGAGLGGVLAFAADEPAFASLAAVGVVGAALAGYAATLEAIHQDARNAERYERTLEALLAIRERLEDVREAAARGDREPVLRFADAVHEQDSLEHREWLEAAEMTRSGVGLLEAALRRSAAGTRPADAVPVPPPTGPRGDA